MFDIFFKILDYSEVWATIFPILIWCIKKPKQDFLVPVKIYLLLAVILNILIDLAYFEIFTDNNFLYNITSIFRLFSFMWFFALFNIPSDKKIQFALFFIAASLITINFIFIDLFKSFSSKTFTLEGIMLIIFCVLYFLRKLKSDEISSSFDASLYIVTGLAVYEAVCFPIFLFYDMLIEKTKGYAVDIWNVHNIAYIVFCLFIARAFYGSFRRTGK